MSYDDLLRKIQGIRNARVDARAALQNKPTRQARPKKDKTAALLKDMSEEEKVKLIALLEADNASEGS